MSTWKRLIMALKKLVITIIDYIYNIYANTHTHTHTHTYIWITLLNLPECEDGFNGIKETSETKYL